MKHLFTVFFSIVLLVNISSQTCNLTYLTTIEGYDVYKDNASNAILFRAKLAIDADGSPRAYGPNNSGLDWTANAGHTGNWWGVVTDGSGNPILQGSSDPYPGMYVSSTSLVQSGYSNTNPLRYVDSENISFIALPSQILSIGNITLGDLVYAKNITNGNTAFAYFADGGPANKLGEGSMLFAGQLGVNTSPKTGGTSSQIIDYIVFPQSGFGQGTHLTTTEIDSIGLVEYTAAGGAGLVSCLDAEFPSLDCSNAVTLTCGISYSGASSNAASIIGTYGCNSWSESGPERVHTITPSANGPITATVSNYTGDLDVYILGSCDPYDCLGTVGSTSSTFANAVAGQTYYIVVDADDGSGSSYDIVVDCATLSDDIFITNESIGSVNLLAGEVTTLSATQNYVGTQNSTALASFDLDYYLSEDCTLDTLDVLLGNDESILGNDIPTSVETANITIPTTTNTGSYYILFAADNDQELVESDETNNVVCIQIAITNTIGIKNNATSEQPKLFPNPTKDKLTYNYQNNSLVSVEIFNMQGQVVLSESVTGNSFSLLELKAGVYLVKTKDSSGFETIQRVIKK